MSRVKLGSKNMRKNMAERDSNGNPNWKDWEWNMKAKLRNWLQGSKAQWKLVVGHHPIWSASRGHGSTWELQGDRGIEVRVIGVVFGKASLLTRVFRFPAAPVESRRESPPQQAVRGWLTHPMLHSAMAGWACSPASTHSVKTVVAESKPVL